MTTKKITLATFKKFCRDNRTDLLVKVRSNFDGMIDGLDWNHNAEFKITKKSDLNAEKNTLDIAGVWLVLGSRDYYKPYDTETHTGISVSNCCGYFTVAVEKKA